LGGAKLSGSTYLGLRVPLTSLLVDTAGCSAGIGTPSPRPTERDRSDHPRAPLSRRPPVQNDAGILKVKVATATDSAIGSPA
jgi:hypothetical protein